LCFPNCYAEKIFRPIFTLTSNPNVPPLAAANFFPIFPRSFFFLPIQGYILPSTEPGLFLPAVPQIVSEPGSPFLVFSHTPPSHWSLKRLINHCLLPPRSFPSAVSTPAPWNQLLRPCVTITLISQKGDLRLFLTFSPCVGGGQQTLFLTFSWSQVCLFAHSSASSPSAARSQTSPLPPVNLVSTSAYRRPLHTKQRPRRVLSLSQNHLKSPTSPSPFLKKKALILEDNPIRPPPCTTGLPPPISLPF